jgi:Inorganic Pyrophosphatase
MPQLAEPSAAQKAAGNYNKDHKRVRGLRVSVENPAGSIRKGTDRTGNDWATDMQHDYGYIRGTTGKDKDHLDVFLGPEPHADHPVFVVNQVDPDSGKFDEHKVMLGFKDEPTALDAYHANYEPGWKGADTVAAMPFKAFRDWAFDGEKATPARAPKGYAAGGSLGGLTPLTNLGGYIYAQPTPRIAQPTPLIGQATTPAPLSYAETASLLGQDNGGDGSTGNSSGVFGGGGLSGLGAIGTGLSIAGLATGNSGLSDVGRVAGIMGSENPAAAAASALANTATRGMSGAIMGALSNPGIASTMDAVLGLASPPAGLVNAVLGLLGAPTIGTVANNTINAMNPNSPVTMSLALSNLAAPVQAQHNAHVAAHADNPNGSPNNNAQAAVANEAAQAAATPGMTSQQVDQMAMDSLMGMMSDARTSTENSTGSGTGGSSSGGPGTGVGSVGNGGEGDGLGGSGWARGGRIGYADGGTVSALDAYRPPAYRPQRRQLQNNDRTADAGVPLSAARGWAAGTLGLPGDLEGRLRSALRAAAAAAPVVRGALTDVAESMAAARPAYIPSGQLGAVRLRGAPTILQVKGPANRRPSADGIPHVQDLIRGTDIPGLEKFGDVSDLHNAELHPRTSAPRKIGADGYHAKAEFDAALEADKLARKP